MCLCAFLKCVPAAWTPCNHDVLINMHGSVNVAPPPSCILMQHTALFMGTMGTVQIINTHDSDSKLLRINIKDLVHVEGCVLGLPCTAI